MRTYRRWLTRFVLIGGLGLAGQLAAEPPAKTPDTAALVRALTSDVHAKRDAALVSLVDLGPTAIQALVSSSVTTDPELAWRANEALQVICRSADTDVAVTIHTELIRLSRLPDAPLAAAAGRSLQHWKLYRHDFSREQLEALGARIADGSVGDYASAEVPGGAIFGGGFFVAGGGPAMDAAEVVEAIEVMPAEEVEVIGEALEEAPKKIAAIPLFGGIFKALGRVAEGVRAADEARGEILGEAIEKKMDAALGRLEELEDVELLEKAPEAPAMEEPEAIAVEEIAVEELAGIDVDDVAMIAAEGGMSGGLPAGTMLLDKNWRGGDAGLRYVADLQQIYNVSLKDALVTDAALTHLKSLPSLHRLEVTGTQITGEGLQKLKHERPQLEITALGPAVIGISGHNHPQGMIVQQVMPETGARRAGIDASDIITHVNGTRIHGFSELTLSLFDKRPGDKVKVDYIRAGKKVSCDVVLTPRSAALPTAPGEQMLRQQLQLRSFAPVDVDGFDLEVEIDR